MELVGGCNRQPASASGCNRLLFVVVVVAVVAIVVVVVVVAVAAAALYCLSERHKSAYSQDTKTPLLVS